jgi:hypothetical protein
MMTRAIYRSLICLHPPAFRPRFEDELLWIYDESTDTSGAALVYDAAISLLRQWLMRSGIWKWLLGGIGAVVYLLIGFGSFLFNWPIRSP